LDFLDGILIQFTQEFFVVVTKHLSELKAKSKKLKAMARPGKRKEPGKAGSFKAFCFLL